MNDTTTATTKACTVCGEVKPLDAFHRTNRVVSGRKAHCAQCARAKRAEWASRSRTDRPRHPQRPRPPGGAVGEQTTPVPTPPRDERGNFVHRLQRCAKCGVDRRARDFSNRWSSGSSVVCKTCSAAPPAEPKPKREAGQLRQALPSVEAWHARAACRGLSPMFDSILPGESQADCHARQARAAQICRRCPVLAECREWADRANGIGEFGVVAGRAVRLTTRHGKSRRWVDL